MSKSHLELLHHISDELDFLLAESDFDKKGNKNIHRNNPFFLRSILDIRRLSSIDPQTDGVD